MPLGANREAQAHQYESDLCLGLQQHRNEFQHLPLHDLIAPKHMRQAGPRNQVQ